jgi:hypothetical protein
MSISRSAPTTKILARSNAESCCRLVAALRNVSTRLSRSVLDLPETDSNN